MDIRQLNYFIQVADCGSYSLASQKLFVSQPALSKTIKNMEEELGITFFYTYQRRQHLTDAGQAFYDKASHLVKEYNALMETSYDGATINKGNITLGFTMASSTVILNSILTGFKSIFPMIDISIMDGDSSSLKENLMKNTIDAAFADTHYLKSDDKKHLDIYPLAECDLVVVASVNNPLSSRESLSYADLDGVDVVLYQREGSSNNELSYDLRATTAKPKIVFTSSQLLTIFDMVNINYGVTIVPYYVYERLQNPNIKAIPINDLSSKRTLSLIVKKSENRSRALNALIEYVIKQKQNNDLDDPQ